MLPIEEIQADVAAVFLSYFERAPEFEAMQWYAQVYENLLAAQGDNPAAVENAFKELAAQIYSDGVANNEVPAGPTVSNEWYVNYLYQNVLGREPDPEGFEYWVAQLDDGSIERPELVGILIAAAMNSEGRDAEYLANRVEVAMEFALWENSNPQILPNLKYNAAEVLLGVNEDPATVEAAQAKLYTSTGQDGLTYTLTPGIDNFEGTPYNDVFNAYPVNPSTGAEQDTLNQFDTLNGDGGWDTLNVFMAENNAGTYWYNAAQLGTVRNIEVVNLYSDGAAVAFDPNHRFMDSVLPPDVDFRDIGIYGLNAARYEGVQELWQINSANPLIDNVGEDVLIGYRDISSSPILEFDIPLLISVVNHADDATSADMAFENVGNPQLGLGGLLVAAGESLDTWNLYGDPDDNGLMVGVMVAGDDVETVNINSELDMLLLYTASHDVLDTIMGILMDDDYDGDLLDAVEDMLDANTVEVVDASGSTGDLAVLVSGSVETIIGGSGDDSFVFLGSVTDQFIPGLFASLDLWMDVDGGDGYDTVGVVDGTFQTQDYDAINQMQNIEELSFLNPEVDLDAAQVSNYKFLEFGALASLIADLGEIAEELGFGEMLDDELWTEADIQNLAADQTLIISENSWVDIALTNAAADVTAVVEDGAWFDLYIDTTSAATVGAKGGVLTLIGEGDAYYSNDSGWAVGPGDWTNGDNGKFSVIDASMLEGDLVLGWEDLDDVDPEGHFYGGLTAGVAEEVILGTGDSVIVLQAGLDGDTYEGTQSSSIGLMDTIYNFNANFDALVGGTSDGTVYSTAMLELGGNVSTLQQAFAAAAAVYDADEAEVLYFHFGGNTYLYADTVDPEAGRYDAGDFALRIVGEHEIEFETMAVPIDPI